MSGPGEVQLFITQPSAAWLVAHTASTTKSGGDPIASLHPTPNQAAPTGLVADSCVLLVLPAEAAGEMHVLLEAMIADMAAARQAAAQQEQLAQEARSPAGSGAGAGSRGAGSPALHYEVVMSAAWQQQFRGLCEDLGFALGMAGEREGMACEGCWLTAGVMCWHVCCLSFVLAPCDNGDVCITPVVSTATML